MQIFQKIFDTHYTHSDTDKDRGRGKKIIYILIFVPIEDNIFKIVAWNEVALSLFNAEDISVARSLCHLESVFVEV